LIFNLSFTKKESIALIGEPFFEKYLRKEFPGSDSLIILLSGFFIVVLLEYITRFHNEKVFLEAQKLLETQIKRQLEIEKLMEMTSNKKNVTDLQEFQQIVVENLEKHKIGGVVVEVARSPQALAVYDVASNIAKSLYTGFRK